MLRTEPRAVAAHFDKIAGRVVVDLVNGCAYAFPAELVQELRGASSDDLAGVEVDGVGFNLHWPKLDVDLYVPALVSGIFGTRAWMASEFARLRGPDEVADESCGGPRQRRQRRAATKIGGDSSAFLSWFSVKSAMDPLPRLQKFFAPLDHLDEQSPHVGPFDANA